MLTVSSQLADINTPSPRHTDNVTTVAKTLMLSPRNANTITWHPNQIYVIFQLVWQCPASVIHLTPANLQTMCQVVVPAGPPGGACSHSPVGFPALSSRHSRDCWGTWLVLHCWKETGAQRQSVLDTTATGTHEHVHEQQRHCEQWCMNIKQT